MDYGGVNMGGDQLYISVLTFLPYRHWKKIMPTDHTSTLLEIFGGSLPTTKHSGGRYLERTD